MAQATVHERYLGEKCQCTAWMLRRQKVHLKIQKSRTISSIDGISKGRVFENCCGVDEDLVANESNMYVHTPQLTRKNEQ
jgi:hypothetical protein